MPGILQQLIIYVFIGAVLVLFAILLIPTLHDSSKTGTREDHDEDLCGDCGYDVRGLLRCPECGRETREVRRRGLAKLREDWPTERIRLRVPGPTEQPVVILNTDDQRAGQLLRKHFQARGIFARLTRSKSIPGAIRSAAGASYALTVWSDDAERGHAIVEHLWPKELRAKPE